MDWGQLIGTLVGAVVAAGAGFLTQVFGSRTALAVQKEAGNAAASVQAQAAGDEQAKIREANWRTARGVELRIWALCRSLQEIVYVAASQGMVDHEKWELIQRRLDDTVYAPDTTVFLSAEQVEAVYDLAFKSMTALVNVTRLNKAFEALSVVGAAEQREPHIAQVSGFARNAWNAFEKLWQAFKVSGLVTEWRNRTALMDGPRLSKSLQQNVHGMNSQRDADSNESEAEQDLVADLQPAQVNAAQPGLVGRSGVKDRQEPDIHDECRGEEGKPERRDGIERHDRAILLCTGFIAIATIVSACIVFFEYRLMVREQEAERPWVGIKRWQFPVPPSNPPAIYIDLVNAGKRPARILATSRIGLGLTAPYEAPPRYAATTAFTPRIVMVPGQDVEARELLLALDKSKFSAALANRLPLYIYGHVDYEETEADAGIKEQYQTSVCWAYDAVQKRWGYCSGYNDAK